MTNINGVNLVLTGNRQTDLENYASLRGIDETQAKTELENALGSVIDTDSIDSDIQFTGDKQEDLKNYAESKNISLDEAKQELESMIETLLSEITQTSDSDDESTTLQDKIKQKKLQQEKINDQLSEVKNEYNSVKEEYNSLESELNDSDDSCFYQQIQLMTLKKRMNDLYEIMEMYGENSLISMLNLG